MTATTTQPATTTRPHKLKTTTTFARTCPYTNNVHSLTLQAGENVILHGIYDTDGSRTYRCETMRNGYRWWSEERSAFGAVEQIAAPAPTHTLVNTPAPMIVNAPVVATQTITQEQPAPEPARTPRSIRNDRTGDVVTTILTNEEIAAAFAASTTPDSWMWYWMAKYVNDFTPIKGTSSTTDMLAFLSDSFVLAIGMGLKRPMIRLHHKNARYKIYLSKKGTLCIKTGGVVPGTTDPEGDEEYMGCLTRNGYRVNDRRKMTDGDREVIERLSADPVGFLAQSSKDMNRCCYCGQPLEDDRSKKVGYGAVCATRWGLPWGNKTYDNKVPAFATLWQSSSPDDRSGIRGVCLAIRQTPRDSLLWSVLGDLLEGAGYAKRPQVPNGKVTMPSA